MTSRYGESSTRSGTVTRRRAHSSDSSWAAAGSEATVTASSVEGRVARAKAMARVTGRCRRETSTTACTRAGIASPRSPSGRATSTATAS